MKGLIVVILLAVAGYFAYQKYIGGVELTDYRVRILNGGTEAVTRVLIESGDGNSIWGTVGVSDNIIDASWEALRESVEYKLTMG